MHDFHSTPLLPEQVCGIRVLNEGSFCCNTQPIYPVLDEALFCPASINRLPNIQHLRTKCLYTFTRMKIVCTWCERVIAGPTVNIEDDDYVVPSICKSCSKEVFEEGAEVDISKIYEVIQAKSGRYEN